MKRLEQQRTVDEHHFEPDSSTVLPIAISIGAAVFPQDGDSYETLLATAEWRMRQDKRSRKKSSR